VRVRAAGRQSSGRHADWAVQAYRPTRRDDGEIDSDTPRVGEVRILQRNVPRTWILTTRDRALSLKSQRKSIDAIGGVQTTIPIATCHDLMVSEPKQLAEILIDRCRLYAT
jgi:hypothetical protein